MLQKKRNLPTTLKAAELAKADAEILELATFSARVSNPAIVQRVADLVTEGVSPQNRGAGEYMDRARFREKMKYFLGSIGYEPETGKAGSLQDLMSDGRLNLIWEMNTKSAQGFGQHKQATTPDVLEAFPCQELLRVGLRREPRPPEFWPTRWRDAGGKFYGGGRMIARKDDAVWSGISRFGRPYPPFDYGSGMGLRAIARGEAVELGIVEWDTPIAPPPASLVDSLQAGVGALSPELQAALLKSLGDGFEIVAGVLGRSG